MFPICSLSRVIPRGYSKKSCIIPSITRNTVVKQCPIKGFCFISTNMWITFACNTFLWYTDSCRSKRDDKRFVSFMLVRDKSTNPFFDVWADKHLLQRLTPLEQLPALQRMDFFVQNLKKWLKTRKWLSKRQKWQ